MQIRVSCLCIKCFKQCTWMVFNYIVRTWRMWFGCHLYGVYVWLAEWCGLGLMYLGLMHFMLQNIFVILIEIHIEIGISLKYIHCTVVDANMSALHPWPRLHVYIVSLCWWWDVNNTWNRSYPSTTYQMIQKIISISYFNPFAEMCVPETMIHIHSVQMKKGKK